MSVRFISNLLIFLFFITHVSVMFTLVNAHKTACDIACLLMILFCFYYKRIYTIIGQVAGRIKELLEETGYSTNDN